MSRTLLVLLPNMSEKKEVFIHHSNFGTYTFRGVNVLDHPVDSAFEGLYSATALDILSGMDVTPRMILDKEFIAQSVGCFQTKTASDGSNVVEVGDRYIENLTILPYSSNQHGDP